MVEIHRAFPGQLSLTTKFTQHCHHPPLPSSKPLRNKFFYDKVTLSHTPSSSRVICERCREKVYQLLERSSLAPSIIYIFSRGENLGRIIDERRPQLEIDRSRERALQSSAKSMSSKCRVPPQGDAISVNVSRGESVQSGQARMQSPPDLPNSSASRYEWSTIRRVELTESGKSSLGLIEKFQRGSHQSWHATTVVDFSSQDASLNFRKL